MQNPYLLFVCNSLGLTTPYWIHNDNKDKEAINARVENHGISQMEKTYEHVAGR